MMKSSLSYLLVSAFLLVCVTVNGGDTTDGFTAVPLTNSNFVIQKPYDIPLDQRYSFKDGVHRLWVYADDKPHDPNSRTQPRTEIRFTGLDYQSGAWQFDGYGFVPNGTSGATVAQIHGASHGATTIILRIYDGNMRYYSGNLIAENLYDKWFRLNLIHDVDGGIVSVFIDGEKKCIKQWIKDQVTCTSNVESILLLQISAITWNQDGETSKYIKNVNLIIT